MREQLVEFLKAKKKAIDPNSDIPSSSRVEEPNAQLHQSQQALSKVLNERSTVASRYSNIGEESPVRIRQNSPTSLHHYVAIHHDPNSTSFSEPHHLLQFNKNNRKSMHEGTGASQEFYDALQEVIPQIKNKKDNANFMGSLASRLTPGSGKLDLYDLLQKHASHNKFSPDLTVHDSIHKGHPTGEEKNGPNIMHVLKTLDTIKPSQYYSHGVSPVSKEIIENSLNKAFGEGDRIKGQLIPRLQRAAEHNKELKHVVSQLDDADNPVLYTKHLSGAKMSLGKGLRNKVLSEYRKLEKDGSLTDDEKRRANDRTQPFARRTIVLNKLRENGDEAADQISKMMEAHSAIDDIQHSYENIKKHHNEAHKTAGLGHHDWSYVQGPHGSHYIVNHTTGKSLRIDSDVNQGKDRRYSFTPGHDVGAGGSNYKFPGYEHADDVALRLKPSEVTEDIKGEGPLSIGENARFMNLNVPHPAETYKPFKDVLKTTSKVVDRDRQNPEDYVARISDTLDHPDRLNTIGHMVAHSLDKDKVDEKDPSYVKLHDYLNGNVDQFNTEDFANHIGEIMSHADPGSHTGRLAHMLTELTAGHNPQGLRSPQEYENEIEKLTGSAKDEEGIDPQKLDINDQNKLHRLFHEQKLAEIQHSDLPEEKKKSFTNKEIHDYREGLKKELYHKFAPPYIQDTVGSRIGSHFNELLNNRNYHDLKDFHNHITKQGDNSETRGLLTKLLGESGFNNFANHLGGQLNSVESGSAPVGKRGLDVVPSANHARIMLHTLLKHQAPNWSPETKQAVQHYIRKKTGKTVGDNPQDLLNSLVTSLVDVPHSNEFHHHENVLKNATKNLSDYQQNLVEYGNIQSQPDRAGLGKTQHGNALRGAMRDIAYKTGAGYSDFDRAVAGKVATALKSGGPNTGDLHNVFNKTVKSLADSPEDFKNLHTSIANGDTRAMSLALKALNSLKKDPQYRDQIQEMMGNQSVLMAQSPKSFEHLQNQARSRNLMREAGYRKEPIYARDQKGKIVYGDNGPVIKGYKNTPINSAFLHQLNDINEGNLRHYEPTETGKLHQYNLLSDAQAHQAAESIMRREHAPHWTAATFHSFHQNNVGQGLSSDNDHIMNDLRNTLAEKGYPVSAPVRPSYNTAGLSPAHYVTGGEDQFHWADKDHPPIPEDASPHEKQRALYKNTSHTVSKLADAVGQLAKEPDEEDLADADDWVRDGESPKEVHHINKLYNLASKLFGNEPNAIVDKYLKNPPTNDQDAFYKFMALNNDSRLSHHQVEQLPGMSKVRELSRTENILTPQNRSQIAGLFDDETVRDQVLKNPDADHVVALINAKLDNVNDPILSHKVIGILGKAANAQLAVARDSVKHDAPIEYKKPKNSIERWQDFERKVKYLQSLTSHGPTTAVDDLMGGGVEGGRSKTKGDILRESLQRDLRALKQDSVGMPFEKEISDISDTVNSILGNRRYEGMLGKNLHNMGVATSKVSPLIDHETDSDITELHNYLDPERINEMMAVGSSHPTYARHLRQGLEHHLGQFVDKHKDTLLTKPMRDAIKEAAVKDPSLKNATKAKTLGQLVDNASVNKSMDNTHLHNVSKVLAPIVDMVQTKHNPSSSLSEVDMPKSLKNLVAAHLFNASDPKDIQSELDKPRDSHEWQRLSQRLGELLPSTEGGVNDQYNQHLNEMAKIHGVDISHIDPKTLHEGLKGLKQHIDTNFSAPTSAHEGNNTVGQIKHQILDKIVRTLYGQIHNLQQFKGRRNVSTYNDVLKENLQKHNAISDISPAFYHKFGMLTVPEQPRDFDVVNSDRDQALVYPAEPEFFGHNVDQSNVKKAAALHFAKKLEPDNEIAQKLASQILPHLYIMDNSGGHIDQNEDAPERYIALAPLTKSNSLNEMIENEINKPTPETGSKGLSVVSKPKVEQNV